MGRVLMANQGIKKFKHLGNTTTSYATDYDPSLLEAIAFKKTSNDLWVSFICPEFTSLCPKTGQPDFAKIFINYIPDKKIVESKSLKLYLFSFRNHGDFHEECVQKMTSDLKKLLNPLYLEVIGAFTPRGGIAIYPFASVAQKSHSALQKERKNNYAPAKYTMDVNFLY